MKCLVRLCPNDSKDGRFVGTVCSPCAAVLNGTEQGFSPAAKRIIASVVLGTVNTLDSDADYR